MVESSALGSQSILVVDDDPSVLAMLRAVLETDGHRVTTAVNASDARKKLETDEFDMVITDMHMETETAGFDVVRAARRKQESPVIMILTAYPMLERQWRDAGADAGLMKGMPIVQLTAEVDKLLAARRQHQ